MQASDQERLSDFGFLSENPLVDIPRFEKVSRLARELPELIVMGSDALREALDALPFIDVTNIQDKAVTRALMRDYHFLQSAYVLAVPSVRKIPFSLAVPSHQLAQRLGQKPILSYASVILDNWQLALSSEFSIKGMRPIRTFTRTNDEVGFLMPHALIEGAAGRVLSQFSLMRLDVQEGSGADVLKRLNIVERALMDMRTLFPQLSRSCEPHVYFKRIRPWLCGFKEVIFEGVAEYKRPQSYIGASGAQSSVLPAIDAALGIRHDHYFSAYIEKLRTYMPPPHCAFIEEMENGPSLRAFVVVHSRDKELRDAYNRCVENVRLFRMAHDSFATRYIMAHDTKARGTGDSEFEKLFAQYAKDTEDALV